MPAPINTLKQRLSKGETLIGCWLNLGDAYAAEVMGTAGFDWLLVDAEHGPNDIRSIRDQLIALGSSVSQPAVRLPIGETWMIKQVLDIGVQTVLVPMVESAAQARELVRACKYPPDGVRGVGASMSRASRFSAIADYVPSANDQICLLVQIESMAAVEALDDILSVDGVDGVFVGPADLSADMGFVGNSEATEVQKVISDILRRASAAGKAAGIFATTELATQRYLDAGARFVSVGSDVLLLARSARSLAERWKR